MQHAVKYAKYAIEYADIYANKYAFNMLDNMHNMQFAICRKICKIISNQYAY